MLSLLLLCIFSFFKRLNTKIKRYQKAHTPGLPLLKNILLKINFAYNKIIFFLLSIVDFSNQKLIIFTLAVEKLVF